MNYLPRSKYGKQNKFPERNLETLDNIEHKGKEVQQYQFPRITMTIYLLLKKTYNL